MEIRLSDIPIGSSVKIGETLWKCVKLEDGFMVLKEYYPGDDVYIDIGLLPVGTIVYSAGQAYEVSESNGRKKLKKRDSGWQGYAKRLSEYLYSKEKLEQMTNEWTTPILKNNE